jgi:Cu(I)/Ag(I) efflux system membrane fusion protein
MNIRRSITLIIVAGTCGATGGYWYGRSGGTMTPTSFVAEATVATAEERPILYYRDSSGAPFWSAVPKKDDRGRDYLPVYEDESAPAEQKPPTQVSCDLKRIRYYRNPMGLPDTSPVPKKDSMGMDYIPVTDCDEQGNDNTVKVSLDRVQRSGVRIEKVQSRIVERQVRAPAIVRLNERQQFIVTLRTEGYIEELHVNATGEMVKAGQPLFRVYSPGLMQAQLEYTLAARALRTMHDANQGALVDSAAQKLRSLGMPETRIREVEQSGTAQRSVEWPSPASGTILEKRVIDGQRVMPGDELYRIADLSTVWVIAQVAERDIGIITLGTSATVTFRAFPNELMEGRVTFVYPELKAETRTARVRIELPNADGRLMPDMYADVVFHTGAEAASVVTVLASSVIDSGTQQLVLVAKGEGRFEPRVIKAGRRGNGFVEVLDGVKENEEVVTSATFLIDAESNLRAALRSFTQQDALK